MDLISYETIAAVSRVEKGSEQLQKLPDNFFESVKNWLAYKQKKSDSTTLIEVHNAKRLLEDIMSRREKKIVLAAMRTLRGELPPATLNDTERKFFDEMVMIMKAHKHDTQEKMMGYAEIVESKMEELRESIGQLRPESEVIIQSDSAGDIIVEVPQSIPEPPSMEPPKLAPKNKLIKILGDIPKFVGADMEAYGPFKKGEMAHLPESVTQILLSRQVAEPTLE